MAMAIAHNSASMLALSESTKNNNKLKTNMEHLALGERVSSAGHSKASEYSISEKMRVKLRGLDQDRQNVQNGNAMLKTAAEAIQQQINILKFYCIFLNKGVIIIK